MENLWISAGKIDQVIPSLSPELSTEHMFVERMFDFPAQKFGPKKSNTCSTRDEKRRVSRRASRARGVAGRSAGERARIFQAGGAGSGRAGSANFRGGWGRLADARIFQGAGGRGVRSCANFVLAKWRGVGEVCGELSINQFFWGWAARRVCANFLGCRLLR